MEQIIKEATLPTIICFFSGVCIVIMLVTILCEYIFDDEDGKKRTVKCMKKKKKAYCLFFVAFLLSAFLFGFNFPIAWKCNKEASNIVRKVVAKNYPDATDFVFDICFVSNEGSFSQNGVDYQIVYKKTVTGEKKLVVTTDNNSRDIDNNGVSYDLPEK